MLVLRFKEADVPREWRVPMNPKIGGVEIPVGLGLITLVLFGVAFINIFTKKTATIGTMDSVRMGLHPDRHYHALAPRIGCEV